MPRKHLIASKINSKQQTQAKLLQKLSKEIKAAAKVGGNNSQTNPRLKLAIEKALKNNLSRDSIERNIHGNQKNEDLISYYEYEMFGPENTKFIITALTDNNNRTLSNLKGYCNKFGGQIAKMNAVKPFFENLGIIVLENQANLTEDQLLEALIDFPVYELLVFDEGIELQVQPDVFYQVQTHLKNLNYEISEAEIKWITNDLVTVSDETHKKLDRLYEQISEDDDIQNCFNNIDL